MSIREQYTLAYRFNRVYRDDPRAYGKACRDAGIPLNMSRAANTSYFHKNDEPFWYLGDLPYFQALRAKRVSKNEPTPELTNFIKVKRRLMPMPRYMSDLKF